MVPGLLWGQGEGEEDKLRWLMSVVADSFGVRPVEICGVSVVAVLFIGFFKWRKLLDLSSKKIPGNRGHSCSVATIGRPWFSSLSLDFFVYLSFADLSGEIEVGLSCYAGEAGNSPHSAFFIGRGTLSQCGSSLLALRNATWENGMMAFLPFLCGYPQVSHSIVLPKFLK